MTADTTQADTDQTESETTRRPRRAGAKRAVKKPGRKAAGRRGGAKRASKNESEGYSATASKLFSRGTRAVSGAYEWAADGASRALPVAMRNMPNQQSMLRMVDERPYILGAIGLGIGAVIGMMLPTALMSGRAENTPPAQGQGRRQARKR